MIDLSNIRIGTSGYYFLDWIGPFYPQSVEKGKMLDFYVNHFDVVEINSSYYRIPHSKVFENMEKKTPANFEFMVKAHKSITHDRADILKTSDQFKKSIEPLVMTGKLRGILMQFPYSFPWGSKNASYVAKAAGLFEGYPIYIEFRHRSWRRDETVDLFRGTGVNFCSVDGPQIDALPRQELVSDSENIYLRLHGRNAEQWWNGGALRYDYLYNEQQLKEWITRIRECKTPIESVYMFFNNCHSGQAVRNAKMMQELLRSEQVDERVT